MIAGRILYLHGFGSGPDSKKATALVERFAGCGVTLEIPDLNGGDFERLTISGQLERVERAAAGEPVCLIGSSLGGYVAALYAARHAEVKRLVLLAPAFGFARIYLDTIGPELTREAERTGWLPVYERRVWWRLIEDARRYEEFPAVTQPTLIFHGLRDEVVPPASSEEFVRRHPHARLRLVDDDHELLASLDVIWNAIRPLAFTDGTESV
jgi:uncharacterized protein